MSQPVAIVTGASRGIGAATARLLGAKGYAVCVHYCNGKDEAAAVVRQIEAGGGTASAYCADLSQPDHIAGMFEAVDRTFGPLAALVNNAALNRSSGSGELDELPWELVEKIFAVNVLGVFGCCAQAMQRMKKARRGAIVNVTSEAAKFGGNRMTHYAASKAAVATMTIGLAREAAAYGIRVNAVSPGVIDTQAHASATPERLAALKGSIPLGRMGTAEEVAQAIAFLLSDEAGYVAGAILPVTGAR